MQDFQRLLVTPQAVENSGFVKFAHKMIFPLVMNSNERTALSKDVCKSISLMAEVVASHLDHGINLFLQGDQTLLKLVESGNHVLAEVAHQCMLSFVYNLNNSR